MLLELSNISRIDWPYYFQMGINYRNLLAIFPFLQQGVHYESEQPGIA